MRASRAPDCGIARAKQRGRGDASKSQSEARRKTTSSPMPATMRITANIRFSFPPRSPVVSAVVVERAVSVVTVGVPAVSAVAVITVAVELVAMTGEIGAVDVAAEAVTGTDEFSGVEVEGPGPLFVVFVAAAVIVFEPVLDALGEGLGDGTAVTTGLAECVAVTAGGTGADVLAEDPVATVVLGPGAVATTAFGWCDRPPSPTSLEVPVVLTGALIPAAPGCLRVLVDALFEG